MKDVPNRSVETGYDAENLPPETSSASGETKLTVETGYDRVAEQYLATKDPEDTPVVAALEELVCELPPRAMVLDLGCGAGIPATRWLARRRFAVTGADISAKQIELARKRVPEATFIKADMTKLDFAPETFDAVVAFHSIIHVPRDEHLALLSNIYRWLKADGFLLATLTVTDFEGEEKDWEGWGATMRWSHYDAETNRRMLREAGFGIQHAEPRTTMGPGNAEETWLWVLARKR